jgi:hypothetical protein
MAIIGNIPYFQTNPYHPLSPKKKRRTSHLLRLGALLLRHIFGKAALIALVLAFLCPWVWSLTIEKCWFLLGFPGIHWDVLGFIGIYWNLLGFIGISWDSIGWFSREHLHRSTSGTTRGEGVISPPKKLEYDLQNCGRPLKSAAPMWHDVSDIMS